MEFKKELLRQDFPDAALEENKYANYACVGYTPQYIIERLNDAFGYDGWTIDVVEEIVNEKEAGAKVKLSIWETSEAGRLLVTWREQWGCAGIIKNGVIDAKKGAISNGLCKCASMFDIGHLAYKGLKSMPSKTANKSPDTYLINKVKAGEKKLNTLQADGWQDKEALIKTRRAILGKEKLSEAAGQELKEYIKGMANMVNTLEAERNKQDA